MRRRLVSNLPRLDLHSKLDSAITENSQMQEFFILIIFKQLLQMCYMLHKLVVVVVAVIKTITLPIQHKVNLFWVSPGNLSFQLGRTGLLTQTSLIGIARKWDMIWKIVCSYITGKNF